MVLPNVTELRTPNGKEEIKSISSQDWAYFLAITRT
jgi:hypothetical protein